MYIKTVLTLSDSVATSFTQQLKHEGIISWYVRATCYDILDTGNSCSNAADHEYPWNSSANSPAALHLQPRYHVTAFTAWPSPGEETSMHGHPASTPHPTRTRLESRLEKFQHKNKRNKKHALLKPSVVDWRQRNEPR